MAELANLGVVVDPSEAQSGANSVNAALDSMSARARRSMNDIDSMGNRLRDTLTKVSGLLAVIGAGVGFGSAINANKEFEQSLSDLSAITGVTGKDLNRLAEDAKEFGNSGTSSANEVVTAFKLVASAKSDLLTTQGALQAVTKEVLTLADASGLQLEPATTALVGTLNQFQLPASDASRVINVLAAASKVGSAEVNDLAATFANSGITAAQASISIEELAAAAEVLALGEKKGADAGTALRNIILSLDLSANEKFRPSLVGLGQALENVNAANLNTAESVKLFQRENINAANTLLGNIGTLQKWTKEVTGTTVAEEQAKIQTDNLVSAQKELANAINVLLLDIGKDLLPTFTLMADSLKESVQWVRENWDEFKRFGDLMLTSAKFVGGYLLVFKGLPLAFAAARAGVFALSLSWNKMMLSMGAGVGTLIAAKNALLGVGAGATTAATAISLLGKAIRALLIIGLVVELARWASGFKFVQEQMIKFRAGLRATAEVVRTVKVQTKAFGDALFDLENPFNAAEKAGEGLNWRLRRIGLEARGELNQLNLDFKKTKEEMESLADGIPTATPPTATLPQPTSPDATTGAGADDLQQLLDKLFPLQAITNQYKESLKQLNEARAAGKIEIQTQIDGEQRLTEIYNEQVQALQDASEEGRRQLELDSVGKALKESLRTEQEMYNDKLFFYNELLQEGAISYETFERAVEKANAELGKTPEVLSESQQLISNFKEGLAGGLADAAVGAKSLGDAMRSLTQEIARAIIKALILKAINSTIGSFGGGAGTAAAQVGTTAATQLQSGTNRVANDGMAFLHKDEMVVPARSAEEFRDRSGSVEDGGRDANQQRQQFNIVNFVDRQAFADWMESNEGQDTLVNSINMNRQSLGI